MWPKLYRLELFPMRNKRKEGNQLSLTPSLWRARMMKKTTKQHQTMASFPGCQQTKTNLVKPQGTSCVELEFSFWDLQPWQIISFRILACQDESCLCTTNLLRGLNPEGRHLSDISSNVSKQRPALFFGKNLICLWPSVASSQLSFCAQWKAPGMLFRCVHCSISLLRWNNSNFPTLLWVVSSHLKKKQWSWKWTFAKGGLTRHFSDIFQNDWDIFPEWFE